MQEHSLIDGFKPGKDDDPDNVKALAVFLRSNGRLDKKLLGEYISNPDRLDLLKAYIGLFDFKGVSSPASVPAYAFSLIAFHRSRNLLRTPCGSFSRRSVCREKHNRLLESQRCLPSIISPLTLVCRTLRLQYSFLTIVYMCAVEIKNSDAAYVLAYSVIMLNTDQHNPQNRVCAKACSRTRSSASDDVFDDF